MPGEIVVIVTYLRSYVSTLSIWHIHGAGVGIDIDIDIRTDVQ